MSVSVWAPRGKLLLDQVSAATPDPPEYLDMDGMRYFVVHVFGVFTATVNFEAAIDDALTWGPIELVRLDANNQSGTSTAAVSTWCEQRVVPLAAFRCTVTPYTSGTVSVYMRAMT